MMYPYMTLAAETEIVYSQIIEKDGMKKRMDLTLLTYESERVQLDMKEFEQSARCHSSQNKCVCDISAGALNDDVLIMKSIREITSWGNNAEVNWRREGRLAVYEVKKSITIGGLDSMKG